MEKRIHWNTGSGDIILSYNKGEGNESVIVSSDVNEGLDRNQTLVVSHNADLKAELQVTQIGRREVFVDDFILKDGTTFNVIKEGYK